MDTNKMRDPGREQFDEFFKANIAHLIRCGAVDQARFIETQREMWLLVWKASRESVVVDWPDQHTYTAPDCAGAAILDCRTAFGKAMRVTP